MDDVDGGYEGKTVLVTGGAGAIGMGEGDSGARA